MDKWKFVHFIARGVQGKVNMFLYIIFNVYTCECSYVCTCVFGMCYHRYLSTIYFPTKAAGSPRLPSISLCSRSVCVCVSDLLMNHPPIATPPSCCTHANTHMHRHTRVHLIKHIVCINIMTHTNLVWRWCLVNMNKFFLIGCLLHSW